MQPKLGNFGEKYPIRGVVVKKLVLKARCR